MLYLYTMIRLKPLISEAGKVDRMYVRKSIEAFNRLSEPTNRDLVDLAKSIISDLGDKPTKRVVNDMENYLHLVYFHHHKRFPRNFPDATDFKEIYELIYGTS